MKWVRILDNRKGLYGKYQDTFVEPLLVEEIVGDGQKYKLFSSNSLDTCFIDKSICEDIIIFTQEEKMWINNLIDSFESKKYNLFREDILSSYGKIFFSQHLKKEFSIENIKEYLRSLL